MHLAIGDVVRDRTDQALGTVAGLASHTDGPLVAFQVASDLHLAEPGDLDLVARATVPATRRRNAARMVGYVLAVLFAFVAGHSAREVGTDWLLTALAGVGGFSAATTVVRWSARLASPRRFRV
ncbi:hypothetical protein OG896_19510 [Streptomyces sp. NBC_00669]|uniref:hypothetical protein n=1 Tax=Streptomyces sp. NBC_00669 TaxID=2976011 RepID=UPI002E3130D7|nr:hypothetical protein [Streptomyces sp. NBC_00669]